MTKPEGNPSEIPSSQKEQTTPKDVEAPLELKGSPEIGAPRQDDQKGKNVQTIREHAGKVWAFIKKIPPFGYLTNLHGEDKAAFWIVVFTALLVYFTYRLVDVTDKVDETTRQTQRAFVHSKGITPGPRTQDASTKKITSVMFSVNWENSGTTPTRNAVTHTSASFRKEPLPDGYNFPDLYPGTAEHIPTHVVIGPKGVMSTTPMYVSIQQMQAVRDGTNYLYFWGWVEYNDVFEGSPKHITKFCTQITNVNSSGSDMTDPAVTFMAVQADCKEHNCYDEECKQPKK